jgi:lipopolysaccharide export system permease protein
MRLLDRYIIREYLRALIAVGLVLTVLLEVSIILEHVDDVLGQNVPLSVSVKWFLLLLPYKLVQAFPVIVLLAVMFSVGNLSRHNEIIAIVSTGVSRARIFLPIFTITSLLAGLMIWFNEAVVPHTSSAAERTERVDVEHKPPPTSNRDIFLRGAGDTYYWMDTYRGDSNSPRMVGPVIVVLSPDRTHPLKRIEARWANHVVPNRPGGESHWNFHAGTEWDFDDNGRLLQVESFRDKRIPLEDDLREFLSVRKDPEEMNFVELSSYISILEQRPGVDLDEYRTELHLKISFPLALLIVAMMAFPCALKTRAGSLLVGFSLAVAFIIGFYGFTAILRGLGHEGHLWPWFAAWAPDGVFLVAASYILGLWRT